MTKSKDPWQCNDAYFDLVAETGETVDDIGSFDYATASLREAIPPLRMTELRMTSSYDSARDDCAVYLSASVITQHPGVILSAVISFAREWDDEVERPLGA
jgi:hypothetical protein